MDELDDGVVHLDAVPVWSVPVKSAHLAWPLPYAAHLSDQRSMDFQWRILHRLFDLPSPYDFTRVSMQGGAHYTRCSRYLHNCYDYAQLSIHGADAGMTTRWSRDEPRFEVVSSLPSNEMIRATSATFRLLYSQRESASFAKVSRTIAEALHRSGNRVLTMAHQRWLDVHNKKLIKFPVRHLAELLFYEERGVGRPASLPTVEGPEVRLRRYLYASQLHNDEAHAAELPPEDDAFGHPHGMLGFLDDMEQLGAFYLGYGVLVARVTGMDLTGRTPAC